MQAEKQLGKTNPKHTWFLSAQVFRKTCSFLQMGVHAGTCALVGLPQRREGDWPQPPTKEGMGEPAQQIPAPEHAGDMPGHKQGEQKLGRG